ncbi:MAG: energy-coupling factor transporter transmembrane protein EcfT [Streptosporangiales bacterium]|nr:energy-coupling factor transporter transmembrane protein EcfT [Streptosporangiales bacterium]
MRALTDPERQVKAVLRVAPRGLHPIAWWLWALGLATAASRTTNPLLLGLVLGCVALVVVTKRGDAPWARGFRVYLVLGLVVVAIRVAFHMLLGTGGSSDDPVLFELPTVPLPEWLAGIRLGGPVLLGGVLAAAYEGLRLATLLCCVGAANVLANPKRALRALPGALHEVGVAVVIALTVAPQVIESGQRVLRARRLRGATGGWLRRLRGLAVPVLQDALNRSLALAAAMDSRGYGRTVTASAASRRATAVLVVGGLVGVCLGAYGLLDGAAPAVLGLPMLGLGVALCVAGLVAGGRRVSRTSYRPDPWRLPEWLVAGSGVVAAALVVASSAAVAQAAEQPLAAPQLGWLPLLAVLVACAPAVVAPAPVRTGETGTPGPRWPAEVVG